MRRPPVPVLTVDTDVNDIQHSNILLTQSPRYSFNSRRFSASSSSSVHTVTAVGDSKHTQLHPESQHKPEHEPKEEDDAAQPRPPPSPSPELTPTSTPTPPSLRLLFSLLPTRDMYILLLPALLSSIVAGGVAPFMTHLIGTVFNAFASFPLTNPTPHDKSTLRHDVGIAALELVALAAAAICLGSITSALWIAAGERNVMRLRGKVFDAVVSREMWWFDTKMGSEGEGDSAIGAGGLMAKFAKDTDDVRMASSLASGMLVQYLTTCLTCLVLAFSRSWALTLVILAAVPLLILIQAISQSLAGPAVALERTQTASAASLTERALTAIATVKAFNAQPAELDSLQAELDKMQNATRRANTVWGITSAASQFTAMGMFVQGFWFGAMLVRKGHVSAGDVMAVFWACLIATSNLQLCIPQLIILAKGKFAMAGLMALVEPPEEPALSPPPSRGTSMTMSTISVAHLTPVKTKKRSHVPQLVLRKIRPMRCFGEFSLTGVSFSYPSRPSIPILNDVSLFFPAQETTFVLGGSGSGKSTVAQLLTLLYTPQSGVIHLDDQDVSYMDAEWLRSHVALVSQTCILFDGTVHENVAMGVAGVPGGRNPADVTREEVVNACRAALVHEFVRDMPDGYDTKLGNGGANLSGGQKQRLAIARAMLRDPTVLVFDEATSALDATSRVLVFEAIKAWRAGKTTIVITHDLSQITQQDFVYVLKSGRVVEQGYRADLEALTSSSDNDGQEHEGEFRRMMRAQGETGGFMPREDIDVSTSAERNVEVEHILEAAEAELEADEEEISRNATMRIKHQSMGLNGWMFDVMHDLTRSRVPTPSILPQPAPVPLQVKYDTKHLSVLPLHQTTTSSNSNAPRLSRRLSERISYELHPKLKKSMSVIGVKRSISLQFTPTMTPSRTSEFPKQSARSPTPAVEDDEDFEVEKRAIERSGVEANKRRDGLRAHGARARWTNISLDEVQIVVDSKEASSQPPSSPESTSLLRLFREVIPQVPHKPLLILGLLACLASGAMTPIFSFLLSRLLFEVSIGAMHVHTINVFGGIVLAIAALDGILMGLKFVLMESSALQWIAVIRHRAYSRVLAQDKKFFDKTTNAPVRLVQTLIKDGEDARNLIAVVAGQCVVVVTMFAVGLIWALVRGWQLTLAGLAIGPVFAATMSVQAGLVAKCERKNKAAREEIAKDYFECISNIRAIRCMSFESVFKQQFDDAVSRAYITGVRGAFLEGCSFGVVNGLIYLAEALLFFVGAVLVSQGTYSYLQMVQVLNLVVFTVTIGAQLTGFTQKIAKASQATNELNKLHSLRSDTDESYGNAKPAIEGGIEFKNVSFSYPERADVPVLQKASLKLAQNECVAIVGSSGSGKSTIAALLQRLYEPDDGFITIGSSDIQTLDIHHLRDHVSVVSQSPNLFNASIAENIAYGNSSLTLLEIQRAAKAAHVHDFIMSLPDGYDTRIGENAALVSGGQAQRLAIARALARPAGILILDECTSSLDPENQAAVMESIRAAKVGKTTLIVTHKLAVMQMCDRIIVVHGGKVAEEGSYEELMQRNSVFSQLASGGEWSGE